MLRLAAVSIKQAEDGTLPDNQAYTSLLDRFDRDTKWQAAMISNGNDRIMIEYFQRIAEAPKEHKPMPWHEREAKYYRAHVTNINKEGGSETVSVKNQPDYKRLAEEARDNFTTPSKKAKGKGYQEVGDHYQKGGSSAGY